MTETQYEQHDGKAFGNETAYTLLKKPLFLKSAMQHIKIQQNKLL